jgi:hypothetical protein
MSSFRRRRGGGWEEGGGGGDLVNFASFLECLTSKKDAFIRTMSQVSNCEASFRPVVHANVLSNRKDNTQAVHPISAVFTVLRASVSCQCMQVLLYQ